MYSKYVCFTNIIPTVYTKSEKDTKVKLNRGCRVRQLTQWQKIDKHEETHTHNRQQNTFASGNLTFSYNNPPT